MLNRELWCPSSGYKWIMGLRNPREIFKGGAEEEKSLKTRPMDAFSALR